ncbi:MAG: hypothetical protein J1E97_07130 [Muribaculaceae bacterium]|nr:hypothetical protein [Muribaculaceae bacterium]
MNDILNTEERRELPNEVFGLPERREYPMPDAAHVRAAEAYFRYCPEDLRPELARNILKFAREYGVDVESPTILSYANE